MKKIPTLLLTACLALGLTACGGDKTNPSPSATPGDAASAKVLNIASTGETTSLYPVSMVPENYTISRLCYETLFTYENGQVVPVLVDTYEISEDGCTLTLHLKQGITFHDGEPFNAQAVIDNLTDLLTGPAAYALPAIGNCTNMEAPDENTVVLTYSTPYYGLLTDFCWPDVCVMVSPKQIEAKNAGEAVKPVGTGPYVYTDYVPGESTTFVRNENYWGGTPYYDQVVSKYIPDAASRAQALQNGEVDLLYGIAELTHDEYQQASSLPGMAGKISGAPTSYRNLTLNFNGILGELAVRQAIACSIDKETISQGISYGVEPAVDKVVTAGGLYEDACPPVSYSYDPDRAASLLDEAGWADADGDGVREKDGVRLSIVCTIPSGDESTQSIATLMQDAFAEVGIEMSILNQETMDWMAGFTKPDGWDMTFQDTYYDYASPTQWFGSMAYMAQAPSLALLDDTDTFMGMIDEFKTTDDDARLKEIFTYLCTQDQEQLLDIPITAEMEMIVYNKDKIADYAFNGCYQFFNPQWITPAE